MLQVPDPSPLLATGEVLVGFSLPMFVAALIAAFGDRFKQSVRLHPRPETGPPRGSYAVLAPRPRPRPLASSCNRPRTSPSIRHGRPDQQLGTRLLRASVHPSASGLSAGDNRRSSRCNSSIIIAFVSSFRRTSAIESATYAEFTFERRCLEVGQLSPKAIPSSA